MIIHNPLLDETLVESIINDISGWNEKPRQHGELCLRQYQINHIFPKQPFNRSYGLIISKKDDHITSMMSYIEMGSQDIGCFINEDCLHISAIGGCGQGGSREAVVFLQDIANRSHRKILVHSIASAVGFYKKMKFEQLYNLYGDVLLIYKGD